MAGDRRADRRLMTGARLVAVVAAARGGVIGAKGAMPWRISSDLKHFKKLTMGKPLIMGRKTWDAIGFPLPGRHSVVITRDKAFSAAGAQIAHGVDEAVAMAREAAGRLGVDEIIVGGGAEIYRALLSETATIHMTEVALNVAGDAFFPPLDPAQWRETARETPPRGPGDAADFSFVTLERDA